MFIIRLGAWRWRLVHVLYWMRAIFLCARCQKQKLEMHTSQIDMKCFQSSGQLLQWQDAVKYVGHWTRLPRTLPWTYLRYFQVWRFAINIPRWRSNWFQEKGIFIFNLSTWNFRKFFTASFNDFLAMRFLKSRWRMTFLQCAFWWIGREWLIFSLHAQCAFWQIDPVTWFFFAMRFLMDRSRVSAMRALFDESRIFFFGR